MICDQCKEAGTVSEDCVMDCVHYWTIEAPNGSGMAVGKCQLCHEEKTFPTRWSMGMLAHRSRWKTGSEVIRPAVSHAERDADAILADNYELIRRGVMSIT